MGVDLSYYVNWMLNDPDSFEQVGMELALEVGTRNFGVVAIELKRQYDKALAKREVKEIECPQITG